MHSFSFVFLQRSALLCPSSRWNVNARKFSRSGEPLPFVSTVPSQKPDADAPLHQVVSFVFFWLNAMRRNCSTLSFLSFFSSALIFSVCILVERNASKLVDSFSFSNVWCWCIFRHRFDRKSINYIHILHKLYVSYKFNFNDIYLEDYFQTKILRLIVLFTVNSNIIIIKTAFKRKVFSFLEFLFKL